MDKTQALITYASSLTQLKQIGKNYLGCCPVHDEKTPSFYVYPDKGKFACFGCDIKGDVLDLYQHITGETFLQAKKALGFWVESGKFKPSSIIPKKKKTLTKKELYLACRQALINGKSYNVNNLECHEFLWYCMKDNEDKMKFVYEIVQECSGDIGNWFFGYVWDNLGKDWAETVDIGDYF